MIQPELPYYHELVTEAFTFDPKRDLAELITHYRRHVSLSTYCMGNEGNIGTPLDHEFYVLAKKLDPTRLVIHQDGGMNTAANSDFGSGRPAPDWEPYRQEQDPRPWCHHEYLNLAVSRDPRTAPMYTGRIPAAVSAEGFRRHLESLGLNADLGPRLSGRGAGSCSESTRSRAWNSARLNPLCNGYIYLDNRQRRRLGDQGLLDQFWGTKGEQARLFPPVQPPDGRAGEDNARRTDSRRRRAT